MDNTGKVKEKDVTEQPVPPEAGQLPAPVVLTSQDIEQLKEKAAKADEYWDRLLRQTADLENYKKRAARERQEAVAFANENLLSKLLPVLDAFEMALAADAKGATAAASLQAGIVMVSQQLKSALAEAGLEEIDAGGKPFDPNAHEAVSQMDTAEAPEGQVVRQIRKGYRFRNRLLRPAGVVVAKKPAV
ncbi:MAG: nucleotide exchange factor GrpE [Limisphaerales bacterium]